MLVTVPVVVQAIVTVSDVVVPAGAAVIVIAGAAGTTDQAATAVADPPAFVATMVTVCGPSGSAV